MQVSRHVYAPGFMQATHAHDVTTCSMLLTGVVAERAGRREAMGRPLSVVLKPAGTAHSDVFGPTPVHLIRITLSPDESDAVEDCLPVLNRWRWMNAGAASRVFLALLRETADGSTGTASLNADAAGLVWDALAAIAASGDEVIGVPPAWLCRARAELDDSCPPPRLSELAVRAGVHPVYLARQFRRFFGSSVSGYIHRVRVCRAVECLVAHQLPLSRAAAVAGFADQSHLSRVFAHEMGVTPARFRSALERVASVQDG